MDVPYLSSNYPNMHRTSCSTRKLHDHIVVGLQLYSARTFHVTMSPGYIRAGRDPSKHHQHLRQYKQPHRTQGITQLTARTYLNLCVPCTMSSRAVDPYLQTLLLRVSLSRLGGKHRQIRRTVRKQIKPFLHNQYCCPHPNQGSWQARGVHAHHCAVVRLWYEFGVQVVSRFLEQINFYKCLVTDRAISRDLENQSEIKMGPEIMCLLKGIIHHSYSKSWSNSNIRN